MSKAVSSLPSGRRTFIGWRFCWKARARSFPGPRSAPTLAGPAVSMVDRDIIERAGEPLSVAVTLSPSRREGWGDAYCVAGLGRPRGPVDGTAAPAMGSAARIRSTAPSRSTRRTRGDCSTTNGRPRLWRGSRRANPYARSPNGSARASGASTTSGWTARTRMFRGRPSGSCVGSARGLLRCPFRGPGRLGGRCRGLASP